MKASTVLVLVGGGALFLYLRRGASLPDYLNNPVNAAQLNLKHDSFVNGVLRNEGIGGNLATQKSVLVTVVPPIDSLRTPSRWIVNPDGSVVSENDSAGWTKAYANLSRSYNRPDSGGIFSDILNGLKSLAPVAGAAGGFVASGFNPAGAAGGYAAGTAVKNA